MWVESFFEAADADIVVLDFVLNDRLHNGIGGGNSIYHSARKAYEQLMRKVIV